MQGSEIFSRQLALSLRFACQTQSWLTNIGVCSMLSVSRLSFTMLLICICKWCAMYDVAKRSIRRAGFKTWLSRICGTWFCLRLSDNRSTDRFRMTTYHHPPALPSHCRSQKQPTDLCLSRTDITLNTSLPMMMIGNRCNYIHRQWEGCMMFSFLKKTF